MELSVDLLFFPVHFHLKRSESIVFNDSAFVFSCLKQTDPVFLIRILCNCLSEISLPGVSGSAIQSYGFYFLPVIITGALTLQPGFYTFRRGTDPAPVCPDGEFLPYLRIPVNNICVTAIRLINNTAKCYFILRSVLIIIWVDGIIRIISIIFFICFTGY